jgi:hypothetical protein
LNNSDFTTQSFFANPIFANVTKINESIYILNNVKFKTLIDKFFKY